MKKLVNFSFYILTVLHLTNVFAQIGIGTNAPRGALEISSATNGFLTPQVALTAANTYAPVLNPQTAGAPITGTVVYNTTSAGAGANLVTPGYYYWDGSLWLRLASGTNSDWTLSGNAGTVAGTSFLGTTDAIDLRIKTNGTDRWNISDANSGQLQSYSLGTAALPAYSFQADQNTGIFSPGADMLGATTNGAERMHIDSNGNIGIATSLPSNRLHVVNDADNKGVFRIDNATSGGFSGMYFFEGASYRGHMGYVNTLGSSLFGGKGSYQLASGNRPIIFSTNPTTELYLERMIIATDGRVGINTNPTNAAITVQPTSNLEVGGSFATGILSIASNATLSGTECKIILSNGASNITIVMPDPADCSGRLLSFSRNTASTGSVTLDPPSAKKMQNLNGTLSNTTTIELHSATGAGLNVQFWSNGTDWYR